jgi:glutaredoxin-dependent peroxiredoxin
MPNVGDKAPAFKLFDTTKTVRTLEEFAGKKTVVAFFPGAFTGVCDKELCSFRDSMSELNNLDAQVVAISVDSPFANRGFAAKYGFEFPLLSDFNREVINTYDIALQDFAGIPGYTVAKRSVFLLDKEGIVRFKWVTDNPGVEPNYEEIKTELAKF